jgi:ADP-heptose:LPS heptosyltransferase
LQNLRAHFPNAWISLLVDGKYRDVHAANTDVDEILSMPGTNENGASVGVQWIRLLLQIKARRYDTVIDLTSTGKTARLALWSGASTISGFETKHYSRAKRRRRIALSSRSGAALENRHARDLYLSPLEAIDIPLATREVRLMVRPEDAQTARERIRAALGDEAEFLVLVHPGARLETRRWPAENYAAVCDALQQNFSCRVLLLSGPGEEGIVKNVAQLMTTEVASLGAPASVPELAATFQCADLLLCNDSGPMHVAAAVGTPIVALFGAQSTTFWHPTSESVTLQASMPCENCLFPDKCRPPDDYQMMCIQRIEIARVVETTLSLMRRVSEKSL